MDRHRSGQHILDSATMDYRSRKVSRNDSAPKPRRRILYVKDQCFGKSLLIRIVRTDAREWGPPPQPMLRTAPSVMHTVMVKPPTTRAQLPKRRGAPLSRRGLSADPLAISRAKSFCSAVRSYRRRLAA